MIIPYNNSFGISTSPHSIGLNNNLTVPNPMDGNWFLNNEKRFLAAGMQGGTGMGCPNCSTSGFTSTNMDMTGYGAGGGGFGDLSFSLLSATPLANIGWTLAACLAFYLLTPAKVKKDIEQDLGL